MSRGLIEAGQPSCCSVFHVRRFSAVMSRGLIEALIRKVTSWSYNVGSPR